MLTENVHDNQPPESSEKITALNPEEWLVVTDQVQTIGDMEKERESSPKNSPLLTEEEGTALKYILEKVLAEFKS